MKPISPTLNLPLVCSVLGCLLTLATASAAQTSGTWKWLWNDAPQSGSGARLKKDFELADAAVKEAVLRVDCDNGAKVFLNGELVATNLDWQKPTTADVKKVLRAGKNEMLVEATNKGAAAAFVASLTLKLNDNMERVILTDASWSAAALGGEDWKPAKVVADYGARPWGDVFGKRDDSAPLSVTKEERKGKPKARGPVSTTPEEVAQP
ncbi:MAG: hypothetical protein NTV80_14345, partial [Verrucomicrobia bacterium]|nr:hypothetical protein [Verrucomicrobiota bacterium]